MTAFARTVHISALSSAGPLVEAAGKISDPSPVGRVTLPGRVFHRSQARSQAPDGIQLPVKVPIFPVRPMDNFQRAHLTVLPGGRGDDLPEKPSTKPFDALVAALARRDDAAAREAWGEFAPVVFRVLRRMLGSHDVEDVAQEVFLRVFDRIGTLRDPQALPAFVLAFTTRTALWELRKRRLRRLVHLDEAGMEAYSVSPDTAARDALAAFYRVLDGLNATDRTVFVLRYMEGLEIKAIAETLNVSHSTTKRRIARALERVNAGVKRHPALREYLGSAVFASDVGAGVASKVPSDVASDGKQDGHA